MTMPLTPWTEEIEEIVFAFIPQGRAYNGSLRLGITITDAANALLANGLVDNAHNLDQLLTVGRAGFYHNGTGPNGHEAEWYADIMMRSIYEHVPFKPVAPEGERVPQGRPLVEVMADYPPGGEQYVIENLIEAGRSYLFASRFKTGKSLLLNDLIEAVATGGEFLGRQAFPGNVLWLQLEDAPASISRRWWRRYPNGSPPEIVIDQAPWRLTESNLAATVEHIKARNYTLVVIDPIINAMPPHDMNSATESRAAMELFRILARDSGAALVPAAHFRKMAGTDGDQVAGSHQIMATVDGLIEIRRTTVKGQRLIAFVGRDWPELPDELVEINPDTLRMEHKGQAAEVRKTQAEKQLAEDVDTLVALIPEGEEMTARETLALVWKQGERRFASAIKAAKAESKIVEGYLTDSNGKTRRGRPKGYRRGSP